MAAAANAGGAAVDAILDALAAAGADVLALLQEYQAATYRPLWDSDPEARLYRAFAERLIGAGAFARAYELAQDGLAQFEHHPELRYRAALALARSGDATKAWAMAEELWSRSTLESSLRSEVGSLLGRITKDAFRAAAPSEPVRRQELSRAAADYYEAASAEVGADSFAGINAATMRLLGGEIERARELASRVQAQATAELRTARPDGLHWTEATLGEAAVILGDLDAAGGWYRRAAERARGRTGDLVTMRRQLRLLAESVAGLEGLISLLDPGTVVVFSGHMLDHPERREPRFPADPRLEAAVGSAIRVALDDLNATVGYASSACGGDILFWEQLQARDDALGRRTERHVTLPFLPDDFYYTSVDFGFAGRAGWRARCDAVRAAATDVSFATQEHYRGDDSLFQWVNVYTQGMALLRAEQLDAPVCALVLVDAGSRPPDEIPTGGTLNFLDHWRAAGHPVRFVDLAAIREPLEPLHVPDAGPRREAPPTVLPGPLPRQVKAMLFADVKNYSKVDDEHAPSFVTTFLDVVAREIAASPTRPDFQNTWGDGLYLVFPDVVACADFALRLLAAVNATPWASIGLPADTTVRMGLHAGPVFPYSDPIIGRTNYFGSHVNRAARTEPVTAPGAAFTSDQFAAALATEPGHPFVCEFVGVEWLAKQYDRCALYRLTRH